MFTILYPCLSLSVSIPLVMECNTHSVYEELKPINHHFSEIRQTWLQSRADQGKREYPQYRPCTQCNPF